MLDVLRATRKELGRVGYAALRVDDVAQHAGVNKTTVYRRWPTKVELVSAAIRQLQSEWNAVPDTGSVREDLRVMLRDCADYGNAPVIRMMMAEMSHPEVQAIGHGIRKNVDAEWALIIARGMARGELPPATSPLLMTEIIMAAVTGRVVRGEEAPDEAFCTAVIDLVIAGAKAVVVGYAAMNPGRRGSRPRARASLSRHGSS